MAPLLMWNPINMRLELRMSNEGNQRSRAQSPSAPISVASLTQCKYLLIKGKGLRKTVGLPCRRDHKGTLVPLPDDGRLIRFKCCSKLVAHNGIMHDGEKVSRIFRFCHFSRCFQDIEFTCFVARITRHIVFKLDFR
jgi:hypothetical protein